MPASQSLMTVVSPARPPPTTMVRRTLPDSVTMEVFWAMGKGVFRVAAARDQGCDVVDGCGAFGVGAEGTREPHGPGSLSIESVKSRDPVARPTTVAAP